MSIDVRQPIAGAVTDGRRGLERDWQSVLTGAAFVAPVSAFEPQGPR